MNETPGHGDANSSTDDAVTLAAIGIVAYALADMCHEALGHGSVFLLMGGKNARLSTVYLSTDVAGRWLAAAGPLMNFLAGGILWLVMERSQRLSARLRCMLWVCMAYNLWFGSGYMVYSGVANFGDWAGVISGLNPAWLWRALLVISGVSLYYLAMRIVAYEGRALLLVRPGVRRGLRIVLIPYLAAGITACLAPIFNPLGCIFILSAAAPSSFVAGWGFFLVGLMASDYREIPAPLRVKRSPGWILAGAIAFGMFVFIFGPGVNIHIPS